MKIKIAAPWVRPICNIENMKLFIAELRSGRWAQGAGRLGQQPFHVLNEGEADLAKPAGPPKLCCLGVACEVAIQHGVAVERRELDLGLDIGLAIITYDGYDEFLPDQVSQWLGIDTYNPYLVVHFREDGTAFTVQATALNDGEAGADGDDEGHLPAFSFAEIADAFERTYIGEAA